MPRTFGSLSAYEPGLMDKARWWLQDTLTPVMGGDARRAGDFVQNKVMPTAEYLPGVGDAMAAGDAVDYFKQGQPIFGTLAAAGAAAGLVPGVGDAVQKGVKKGIRAYHGSPHDFDKFSLDKIGTGEGAQAYGHGLYFADSEGVARSYRDNLSDPSIAQKKLEKAGGDVDKAIADAKGWIEKYRAGGADSYANAVEEELRMLEKFKETGEWSKGRMYEVNINADPNDFLDWDKPLSEQPESVRRLAEGKVDAKPQFHFNGSYGSHSVNNGGVITKVSNVKPNTRGGFDASFQGENIGTFPSGEAAQQAIEKRMADAGFYFEPKGADVYSAIVGRSPLNSDVRAPAPTVDALRQAGIPGIKYLDAGSRSAGDGSRNYVVFDDALIEILRKYGLAGLGIGVGAGGFGSLAPQDDNYQPPQL